MNTCDLWCVFFSMFDINALFNCTLDDRLSWLFIYTSSRRAFSANFQIFPQSPVILHSVLLARLMKSELWSESWFSCYYISIVIVVVMLGVEIAFKKVSRINCRMRRWKNDIQFCCLYLSEHSGFSIFVWFSVFCICLYLLIQNGFWFQV